MSTRRSWLTMLGLWVGVAVAYITMTGPSRDAVIACVAAGMLWLLAEIRSNRRKARR